MLYNVADIGREKGFLSSSLDRLQYMEKVNVKWKTALALTLLPLIENNEAV